MVCRDRPKGGTSKAWSLKRPKTKPRRISKAFVNTAKSPTEVVIADIYQPDCDGLEVIVTLRHEYSAVRIVAMSAQTGKGVCSTRRNCWARMQLLRTPLMVTYAQGCRKTARRHLRESISIRSALAEVSA